MTVRGSAKTSRPAGRSPSRCPQILVDQQPEEFEEFKVDAEGVAHTGWERLQALEQAMEARPQK